jgi:hypothetical protein
MLLQPVTDPVQEDGVEPQIRTQCDDPMRSTGLDARYATGVCPDVFKHGYPGISNRSMIALCSPRAQTMHVRASGRRASLASARTDCGRCARSRGPASPERAGEPSARLNGKRWCAEGLKGEEREVEGPRIGRWSGVGNQDVRFAANAGIAERRRGGHRCRCILQRLVDDHDE